MTTTATAATTRMAAPHPASAIPEHERDTYGGWSTLRLSPPSGFFGVAQHEGRWWLTTPEGNAFICKAVQRANYTFDEPVHRPDGFAPFTSLIEQRYGSERAFAAAAVARLRAWGFNALGAHSHPAAWKLLPYTLTLHLAVRFGASWQQGTLPDFFSREFEESAFASAREQCGPLRDDPRLIGYFTDNELGWQRRLREGMPPVEVARLARRYAEICRAAVRAADPNHLVLGCRLAQGIARDRDSIQAFRPEPVLHALAAGADVLTFNCYDHVPAREVFDYLYDQTGLPLMVTEFSFKATDSGLPNAKGAGKPVATQQDRAEGFARYVAALMDMPYVVGYHWFQYVDQPPGGRFDGENCNYGLITFQDQPYALLTERAAAVNPTAEARHVVAHGAASTASA